MKGLRHRIVPGTGLSGIGKVSMMTRLVGLKDPDGESGESEGIEDSGSYR